MNAKERAELDERVAEWCENADYRGRARSALQRLASRYAAEHETAWLEKESSFEEVLEKLTKHQTFREVLEQEPASPLWSEPKPFDEPISSVDARRRARSDELCRRTQLSKPKLYQAVLDVLYGPAPEPKPKGPGHPVRYTWEDKKWLFLQWFAGTADAEIEKRSAREMPSVALGAVKATQFQQVRIREFVGEVVGSGLSAAEGLAGMPELAAHLSQASAALRYDWLASVAARLLAAPGGRPGIKVLDFSEVPSDVLPVVTGLLARLLYEIQFWLDPAKRTPFLFVCDEAHLYLPVKEDADAVEKQALYCFERIAKEGRKYGVSLLVVSQRPADVSRTILSQCNNFLVMRLTNDQDQSVVRRLVPDSLAGILDGLPLLDTGEAFLIGDAVLLPSRIKLNLPSIEPLSQTRDFWREWDTVEPDAAAVAAAVETLRRQSR